MKYAIEMSVILMVFMIGTLLLMDFVVALETVNRMHHDRDYLVRQLEVSDGDVASLKDAYQKHKSCEACVYQLGNNGQHWKITIQGNLKIHLLQLELPFETFGIAYKS